MSTFDTPEPIRATIDVVTGGVRMRAGERRTTIVEVAPTDPSDAEDRKAAELTRIEYANGQLLVKAPKLRSWLPKSRGASIDVTIELPAGSAVHGTAGSADFRCTGELGECQIKTGIGDICLDGATTLDLKSGVGAISANRVTSRADVTAGAGAVRLRELDAGGVVKNSNGATWIGVAGDDLRVNAANGSITVELAQADVSAKSANGDVRLVEVVSGSIVLETQIGELEVGIREGTAAWLDVSATAGRVHNSLDAADSPEPSTTTVAIRARTSVGNVLIRRP